MSDQSYLRQVLPIPGGELIVALIQDRPLPPALYEQVGELLASQKRLADTLNELANEDLEQQMNDDMLALHLANKPAVD